MHRKRKNYTPNFRLPTPIQPMSGEHASLQVQGVFPYNALVQVAAEDTKKNYVICRGFDTRIARFIDYEEGNPDKPGLPVAKPYGKRVPDTYREAQVFLAVLPLQTTNPSPQDVNWRIGQNPGKATAGEGHPQDLDEQIDELYTDEGQLINWMLIDSSGDEFVLLSPKECFKSYPKEPAEFYVWEVQSGESDPAPSCGNISQGWRWAWAGNQIDGLWFEESPHCPPGCSAPNPDEAGGVPPFEYPETPYTTTPCVPGATSSDCEWIKTDETVMAEDPNDVAGILLPLETQWARRRGGCDVYDLIASGARLRRVKAAEDIACGAMGRAVIYEVQSCSQSMEKEEDECDIDVCNSWGAQQCIVDDDELEVEYLKRGVWTPRYRKNSIYRATLTDDMCPDNPQGGAVGIEGATPMDYCEDGDKLALITEAENEMNHAGMSGDPVYVFRDNTVCDGKLYIFDVKKKCQDLAAPIDMCDGDGIFIFKDDCAYLEGSVRFKNAIESCTPEPVKKRQIPLNYAWVYRPHLEANGCVITLSSYPKKICVFDDGQEIQPITSGFTFGTTSVLDNLYLELSAGEGSGQGSGEACPDGIGLWGSSKSALTLPGCSDDAGEPELLTSLPLSEQDVVANIDMSGCPAWVNATIVVLATCGAESSESAECEDWECPPDGSGSGSGQ